MKVYFAGIDRGDYITSLAVLLKEVDVDVIYAHESFINKDIPAGKIIHLHWPESYFPKWKVSSNRHLTTYLSALQYYRSRNPIVFTLHNILPHDGKSGLKLNLYSKTIKSANYIHHLGPESVEIAHKTYSSSVEKKNKIISHHVLPIPNEVPSKTKAKRTLSIPNKKFLTFSPGSIRNLQDMQNLWNQYEKIDKGKNLRLIIHKYRNLLNRYAFLNILKHPKICYKEFMYRFLDKRVSFINQHLHIDLLCLYLSATDLILLPRAQNLNSGIPFLTVNFNSPINVQAGGNIFWSLRKLGYHEIDGVFKPTNICTHQFNETVINEMKVLYEMLE
jgi:hypothetical protein